MLNVREAGKGSASAGPSSSRVNGAHSSAQTFAAARPPLCRSVSAGAVELEFVELAHPYVASLDSAHGTTAFGCSFQPCRAARSQDRYIVERLEVGGEMWTLTGVFDGHLGEATVEHTAHHLPVIIHDFLRKSFRQANRPATTANSTNPSGHGSSATYDPRTISSLLQLAISSFDAAIASDVLDLFPGGLSTIDGLSDRDIRAVLEAVDPAKGVQNLTKAQLCMYGTTALVALVDPRHENLWVATLGDCQAVLATRRPGSSDVWSGERLTRSHNCINPDEIARVRREHPGEVGCIENGRVLGAIAPFRCIGDHPFKQPAKFTRRILYNLDPGYAAAARTAATLTSPWERFLTRNLTPPYISAEAEVTHRTLVRRRSPSDPEQLLVLFTDGLPDLFDAGGATAAEMVQRIASTAGAPLAENTQDAGAGGGGGGGGDNLALRVLRNALGLGEAGREADALLLAQVLGHGNRVQADAAESWIDDVTVVVQTL